MHLLITSLGRLKFFLEVSSIYFLGMIPFDFLVVKPYFMKMLRQKEFCHDSAFYFAIVDGRVAVSATSCNRVHQR